MVDPVVHTSEESSGATSAIHNGLRSIDRGLETDRKAEMEVPEETAKRGTDSDVEDVLDQAGRPLGTRALQTRQRILDATVAELEQKSMRDLRVIDIARRVGSSPATFYQYFKDVEDVVLHISEQVSTKKAPGVAETIRGNWEGPEGYERARKVVELGIELWDADGPVLRVRNNAADEGEERFRAVRAKSIMPTIKAFTEEIAASQQRARDSGDPNASKESNVSATGEWLGGTVDPMVAAMAVFAVADRLAMYHQSIEDSGAMREDIIDTAASMIQFVMTSRR